MEYLDWGRFQRFGWQLNLGCAPQPVDYEFLYGGVVLKGG